MRTARRLPALWTTSGAGILVALGVSSAPLPWILVALGFGVGLSGLLAGRTGGLVAWYVGVTLAAIGLWEGARVLASPQVIQTIEPHLQRRDPVLGLVPVPDQRVRARKSLKPWLGDAVLLYDVVYTLDEDGLRAAPEMPRPRRCVVIFGCSVAFGSGVDDDETMGAQVVRLSRGRVAARTFASPGWGPHHMLAAIESGRVLSALSCQPDAAVYVAMPDHVARAAGLRPFARRSPRYVLQGDELVRKGLHVDSLPSWKRDRRWQQLEQRLLRSPLFDALFAPRRRLNGEHVELAARIVRASADRLTMGLPELDFHVLQWNDAGDDVGYGEALEEQGLMPMPVLDPEARRDRVVLSPHDRHPSPAGHRRMAEVVLEVLAATSSRRAGGAE